MIKSWSHKGLKRFFETGNTSGIQSKHSKRLEEQLDLLNTIVKVEELRLPGYALHKLSGRLSDYFAITVNGGWRLIFTFENGNVFLVDYLNYH